AKQEAGMPGIEPESMRCEQRERDSYHCERDGRKKVGGQYRAKLPAPGLLNHLNDADASSLASMRERETLREQEVQRRRIGGRHSRREEKRSLRRDATQHSADQRSEHEAKPECHAYH